MKHTNVWAVVGIMNIYQGMGPDWEVRGWTWTCKSYTPQLTIHDSLAHRCMSSVSYIFSYHSPKYLSIPILENSIYAGITRICTCTSFVWHHMDAWPYLTNVFHMAILSNLPNIYPVNLSGHTTVWRLLIIAICVTP